MKCAYLRRPTVSLFGCVFISPLRGRNPRSMHHPCTGITFCLIIGTLRNQITGPHDRNPMHTSVLDPRPGPATEKPPPLPARNRAVIALHTTIVTAAVSGYLLTGAATGSWTPHPLPTVLMTLYFAGLTGLIGYAAWRGVTGRAQIDAESLAAIKSRCAREAARRPGPASAVAMRPLLPHPCSGYVYAAVTAKRLGTTTPGATEVSLRTTPGWALSRRTAWHRGLTLTAHQAATGHQAAPSNGRVGTLENPHAPHTPLTGRHHNPALAQPHCN